MRAGNTRTLAFAVAALLCCAAAAVPEEEAVRALATRMLGPAVASLFTFTLDPSLRPDPAVWGSNRTDGGTFAVWSDGATVGVSGTSAVAMASAVNWWLKYKCRASISWEASQVALPDPLPAFEREVRACPVAVRYWFNTCTFGYSTAFWSWARWEWELDWMAMQGVNLPLAFVGQELAWAQTYAELGIPLSELAGFFTGPAFLPWNRMGNIDGWGGPLPEAWMRAQAELQKRIVARMRDLGMTPVLPAFAGHVPDALATHYPNASITRLASWLNPFPGPLFLSAVDPLFQRIGSTFLRKITDLYGTSHYYNADPFNENTPPTSDPAWISEAALAILASMRDTDPLAVWVLQGWFLYNGAAFWREEQARAFLTAVPRGSMLVLDLFAEQVPLWNRGPGFQGQQFAWCMLHNFGGRPGIFGAMELVNEGFAEALANSPDIVGAGATPEAIETTSVMYDLLADLLWTPHGSVDLEQWVAQYSERRYASYRDPRAAKSLAQAWQLLRRSALNCHNYQHGPSGSFIASRPDVVMIKIACSAPAALYYDPHDVCDAWSLMNAVAVSSPAVAAERTFSNDLALVAVQALNNAMLRRHAALIAAWNTSRTADFEANAKSMLRIVEVVDDILSAQPFTLLGTWIERAKASAAEPSEVPLMEQNARRQITLWGKTDSEPLFDYANKHWGGLVRGLYKPRWAMFTKSLRASISKPLGWDRTAYWNQVKALEESWVGMTDSYPTEAVGDGVAIATAVFKEFYVSECTSF